MAETLPRAHFVFPPWTNYLLPVVVVMVIGAVPFLPVLVGLGFSPKTTDVGYSPVQPVAFSHAVHAGQLGMDCRYCHTTVEKSAFAAIPATQTCMNCHSAVKTESPKLMKVRESVLTGKPIEWVKVHDLPDYSYFNHSAHVNHGVSCVSCHGRVDQMEVVTQVKPLSMGWCLECHREPEKALRPKEEVTNLSWLPPNGDQLKIGRQIKKAYDIHGTAYMTSCSTCHR
jgi:hypothetical protein